MRNRPAEDRYIPAVIVKAARVWVDLVQKDHADASPWSIYRWKMRRDTQNEGSDYSGSNASFLTLDQHAWEETQSWAREILKDNGLVIDRDSRWRGREVELADLIGSLPKEDAS